MVKAQSIGQSAGKLVIMRWKKETFMTLSEEQTKITPGQIEPGMKFNHWTVIEYSHTNAHRIKYFLCKCDCGTFRKVRGTALIQGTSKACSRACQDNIVNQRFGKWVVLKKDKSRRGYYICKCDCGTVRSVRGISLKNQQTKSCGCNKNTAFGVRKNTIEKYKNYIGTKINDIEILSINSNNRTYNCKCFCGKEFQAECFDLISGNTQSCGCKRKDTLKQLQENKYNTYIGKHLNNLTILECYYKNNSFWFKCKCDCGKIFEHQATKIITSYIQSCGCIKSKAEEKMDKFLSIHGIPFKREFKFEDCRDKQPLPFDFAIFNTEDELIGLIELNGQQHYIEGGWNTKEHLEYVQKHDKIKHTFCLKNDIPLMVIPYQYYNEVEKFLTTSDFWQMITKNFND